MTYCANSEDGTLLKWMKKYQTPLKKKKGKRYCALKSLSTHLCPALEQCLVVAWFSLLAWVMSKQDKVHKVEYYYTAL